MNSPHNSAQHQEDNCSCFQLILKITIIPSMQLSRIRERPGVSIFQLRMDNGAGGVWALWWHHPTLIVVHTCSLSRGVAKLICASSWLYYVGDWQHRDSPPSGAKTGRNLHFILRTIITVTVNLCVPDRGKMMHGCERDVWGGPRSELSERIQKIWSR